MAYCQISNAAILSLQAQAVAAIAMLCQCVEFDKSNSPDANCRKNLVVRLQQSSDGSCAMQVQEQCAFVDEL